MKRIQYACLSQTIRFERNEKLERAEGIAIALEERERYLKRLDQTGTVYHVDRKDQLEDGTPILVIRRQYNSYPVGEYLN